MTGLCPSLGAAALILSLFACGGDSFSPTEETVAGSYSAATFTATSGAVTLAADGTTTGRLLVPGSGEVGEDLDENLTGTWTLDGSTVTFSQTADTFIRDAPFTAGRDRLTGEGTFDGQTIRLILIKAG